MGIEEDYSSDGGGREAGSEEVNYEDAGGDEEGSTGGVEGEAVVGGEVKGDFGG